MPVPEANTEMLLYQTLIGAWPLAKEEEPEFKERLKMFMIKAVKEAKTFTGWVSPDPEYEEAVTQFVDYILEESDESYFLKDLVRFVDRIAFYGAINALSQVLFKIACPGIPDFYQGNELWDFSLVDPDNRRQVNFEKRIKSLDELIWLEARGKKQLVQKMLESWKDGTVKLYITYKALKARQVARDVFQDGRYVPLRITGAKQEYVIAFLRNKNDSWVLVAVPRLTTKLVDAGTFPIGEQVWKDGKLILPENRPDRWTDIFTGHELQILDGEKALPLCEIFRDFPLTLLTSM
jgi:(1->4)-alpha-D-glucan 1-alpha-D-glucosylmutase